MKKKASNVKRTPAVAVKRIVSCLSEERILQLDNDLSEDIASGTVKDWRAVARYWRNQNDHLLNNLNAIRPSLAALTIGWDCVSNARKEIAIWLKAQGS
jgi:hypothetical protein